MAASSVPAGVKTGAGSVGEQPDRPRRLSSSYMVPGHLKAGEFVWHSKRSLKSMASTASRRGRGSRSSWRCCMKATCLQIAHAARPYSGKKKTASEYAFECPVHDDQNPSLLVNDHKNCFFCGPCGIGGGPWKLAALFSGFNPNNKHEIALWLRERGL